MSERRNVAAIAGIAMAIAGMPPSAVRHLARQGRPTGNPPEVDAAIDAQISQAITADRIARAEAKRKRKSAKRLGTLPASTENHDAHE
jgi:hypothetical protein